MKVYKKEGKFFMEDQGNIVELTPNKDYWLKLPANSCNRVWTNCARVDKAIDQCVDYGDEVKMPRVVTGRSNVERKPLEDYLDGDDRKLYLELVEKAKKAREEANKKKPLTKLEKAQREFEKWQKEVARLTNMEVK